MFKTFTRIGLAMFLAGSMSTAALAQNASSIKIGWAAWSDAEFATKLAARLIEDNLDTKVELIQTDIAPIFQGLSRGDIDLMLMAWLPETHRDYFERVKDNVETLGTVYDGAKLGWVVPDYIPESEISSIEDLAKDEVREKLEGQVQGIDPGAGLTRLSQEAITDYGLDYELQISSEAGMLTTIDRSMRSETWFVATSWSPHWMFGKYELRYIDDPKGSLGDAEHVDILSRTGFAGDHPEVAEFLSRMKLPIDELETGMFDAQETSYDEAVERYIENNPERIKEWLGTE